MKRVYQKVFEKYRGDCMRATLASLLELELEEVPDFPKSPEWHSDLFKFLNEVGYQFDGTIYNSNNLILINPEKYSNEFSKVNIFDSLKNEIGVNGYFLAAVYSPNNYNKDDKTPATHAVIIDNELNIIHDPNPSYKDIKEYPETKTLGHNGIIYVLIINPK